MSQYVKFERPYAIRDAGGLIVYESAALPAGIEEVVNSEASATIGRGEAVLFDPATSVLPRWDYSTAGTDTLPMVVLKGKRVSAAANKGWIGVAMENIPAGQAGDVLTLGIVAVKCLNPPAVNTTGAMVIGSTTAGSVDGNTTPLVAGTLGTSLGMLLVPAGTSAGQSGSLTQLIAKLGAGY